MSAGRDADTDGLDPGIVEEGLRGRVHARHAEASRDPFGSCEVDVRDRLDAYLVDPRERRQMPARGDEATSDNAEPQRLGQRPTEPRDNIIHLAGIFSELALSLDASSASLLAHPIVQALPAPASRARPTNRRRRRPVP